MGLLDGWYSEARQSAENTGRLIRIEQKLDLILDHLGLDFQPFSEEVRQAAAEGNKLLAIKLYRERTGAGLAEAKRDIEAYMSGR